MVVGGAGGGRMTVTSPAMVSPSPLSPPTSVQCRGEAHPPPAFSQASILDLDSQQYIEPHQRLHQDHPLVQKQQLSSLQQQQQQQQQGLNVEQSSPLHPHDTASPSLLTQFPEPSDCDMRRVLNHISYNVMSNLSIIDSSPLSPLLADSPMGEPPNNNLNNNNHQNSLFDGINHLGESGGPCSSQPFLPNIVVGGGGGGASNSMGDMLNTPTQSSESVSFTHLKADLEIQPNS